MLAILPPPLKIDRRQPRTGQVYEALRSAILDLTLKPRTQISESGICRQGAVSRTPVREAMIRLAQEGLIDIFPQHGTFVAPISVRKVVEGHFVRQTLELAMLEKAARCWSPDHTAAVDKLLASQRAHAAARSYADFYREDERFHQYFAQAAGLPGVSCVVDGAVTHLARVRQLANPVEGHMEQAIDEHERILVAVKSGDIAAASVVLTRHHDRIFETVQRMMRIHAEYFDGPRPVQDHHGDERSNPRVTTPAR